MLLFLLCIVILAGLTFLVYLLCDHIEWTCYYSHYYTQIIWSLWAGFITWCLYKLFTYVLQ